MDEIELPRDASWPAGPDPADKPLPEDEPKRPSNAELARTHRDAEALELRRQHYSYPQIAKALSYPTTKAAKEAVDRAAERLRVLHEDNEVAVALELARYDHLSRIVMGMLDQKHYVISNSGRVVEDPRTGEPLIDIGPTLAAIDRLVVISRERRRIQALDKPAVTRVEVRTQDAMDHEIEQLLNLIAAASKPERRQIANRIAAAPPPGATEAIVDAEVVEDPAQGKP